MGQVQIWFGFRGERRLLCCWVGPSFNPRPAGLHPTEKWFLPFLPFFFFFFLRVSFYFYFFYNMIRPSIDLFVIGQVINIIKYVHKYKPCPSYKSNFYDFRLEMNIDRFLPILIKKNRTDYEWELQLNRNNLIQFSYRF